MLLFLFMVKLIDAEATELLFQVVKRILPSYLNTPVWQTKTPASLITYHWSELLRCVH